MADKEISLDEENATNMTGRQAASTEGLALAYTILFLMAIGPILVGAIRSVAYHHALKKKGEKANDRILMRDAAMFPIYASCALFGLYVVFKYLPKEYVNLLLNILFFSLGVSAIARASSVVVDGLLERFSAHPCTKYAVQLSKYQPDVKKELFKSEFTVVDVCLLVIAGMLVTWHFVTKHWVLNNIMGLAFCFNAIEMISLDSVGVGCLLLGGLFLYDVFWVFGTDVMVTVAKSFDAPIKLMVPLDLPENGLAASNFGMLGLGDIVIPGLFIALLCRFDSNNHPSGKRVYFLLSFAAYIIGLATTIAVMHLFNAAQPALLYLVPCCVGLPLLQALIRRELVPLFKYSDYPDKLKEVKQAEGYTANKITN